MVTSHRWRCGLPRWRFDLEMNRPISTGKSLKISGKKVGLKVHPTYLEDRHTSKIPHPSSFNNKENSQTRSSKRKQPLYQTVVIKNPKILLHQKPTTHSITSNNAQYSYLIRKYGRLWLLKVYGRVSPTEARHHRSLVVLRRFLLAWHKVYWFKRLEWRLEIRAACHHKYNVWLKVWKAWRNYVMSQNTLAIQKQTAIEYATNSRLKYCFKEWRVYHEKNKIQQQTIETLYRRALTKRVFNGWKQYYDLIMCHKQMTINGNDHYYNVTASKVLNIWKSRYTQRQYLQYQNGLATDHYNVSILTRLLISWKQFISNKKRYVEMKVYSQRYADQLMKNKIFYKWRIITEQVQRCRILAGNNYRLLLYRKYMSTWIQFTRSKRLKVTLKCKALYHYENRLKLKVLNTFSSNVILQKKILEYNRIANNHHYTIIIQHVWNIWLRKCEHYEDIKLRPQFINASKHYRQLITTKCFDSWKKYLKLKKHKQGISEKIRTYHRQKMLPRCFNSFCINVKINEYRKNLEEKSNKFRRSILLSIVFYTWWRRCDYQMKEKSNYHIAESYCYHWLLKGAILLWRKRTLARLDNISLEVKACYHYNHTVSMSCFMLWKKQLMNNRLRRTRESSVNIYYDNSIVLKCFKSWIKYVSYSRHSNKQVMRCNYHYSHILLARYLSAWKVYHQRIHIVQTGIDYAVGHYNHSVCSRVLYQWKTNVNNVIRFRGMLLDSMYFSRHKLIKQVFTKWRKVTVCVLNQERIEIAQAIDTKVILDKVLLKTLFVRWFDKMHYTCKERFSIRKACCHHGHALLVKTFQKWMYYHQSKSIEKGLQCRAEQFDTIRISSLFYIIWRIETIEMQLLKQNTIISLWKWSQTLQRKCLRCWQIFIINKKRKRRRYSKAMDYYRTQLLQEGVTQWLNTASAIQGARNKKAFNIYVKDFSHSLECARRCLIHWKNKVEKRRKASHDCHGKSHDPWIKSHDCHVISVVKATKSKLIQKPDVYWNKIISNIDTVELPKISRPPPRRPDYLFETTPPFIGTTNNYIIDSIPNPPCHLVSGDQPSLPLGHSANDSFLSVTTVHSELTSNNNNKQFINNCIIRPKDWKLLPPTAFK